MTVLAVCLFGSQARGDQDESSDVDLLLITSERQPRHSSMGTVSLSMYPIDDLIERAAAGDLFLCHLANEARPMYDPEGNLPRIKAAFQYRDSYDHEVGQASALGWLLGRFADKLPNPRLSNRRIAWCVRTILIAKSAECRTPLFAPAKLAAFSEDLRVLKLIQQKSAEGGPDQALLTQLREFLHRWGTPDPVPAANSAAAYETFFLSTHNEVGRKTLRGFLDDFEYGAATR